MAYGCVIMFSSTAATLTEVTGAGNVGEITVYGEGFEASAVCTELGDLTTGLISLDVWTAAQATIHRFLKRLDVVADSDADDVAYIVFASNKVEDLDDSVTGATYIGTIPKNGTYTFDFGSGLLLPYKGEDACLTLSLTTSLFGTPVASNKWKIRANIFPAIS